MKKANPDHLKTVLSQLKKDGFLLESDPKLPSVCSLITGEPLRGSWWSHPLSHTIFQVNEQLEDHPELLITKLISGKVTFVHKKLWAEILAIGLERAPWQMKGMTTQALVLMKMIDDQGSLRTDQIAWPASAKAKPGDAARELEKRLLVHSGQLHTESGAHAKVLETWKAWAKRVGFKAETITAEAAQQKVERRLKKVNEQFGGKATLPWA